MAPEQSDSDGSVPLLVAGILVTTMIMSNKVVGDASLTLRRTVFTGSDQLNMRRGTSPWRKDYIWRGVSYSIVK